MNQSDKDFALSLARTISGYEPMTNAEAAEPADLTYCSHKASWRAHDPDDGGGSRPWPHIFFDGEWCPVPTMGTIEDCVLDSTCPTPTEDEVEPDHPDSWLSILGLI